MKEYKFPKNPDNVGYLIFPEVLENDENVFFHGTSLENLESIQSEGFQPSPPLESVSFSRASSLAGTVALLGGFGRPLLLEV